ncbi:MAG: hypothetical protein R6U51_04140 [Anaerolineales bacterium]
MHEYSVVVSGSLKPQFLDRFLRALRAGYAPLFEHFFQLVEIPHADRDGDGHAPAHDHRLLFGRQPRQLFTEAAVRDAGQGAADVASVPMRNQLRGTQRRVFHKESLYRPDIAEPYGFL